MRVVDEFRDPDVIAKTADEIRRLADPGRHYRLMEVCGGHTHAIYRFGLKDILPSNIDKHVMFFAIGFETTAPSPALTILRAKAEGIHNFSLFCNHVTIIPAIRAILDSPDMRLDAFIGPGHVSTVIGCRPYEWIAANGRKPIVVSGFEPLDMLQSIVMLLRQLKAGEAKVENQYKRVVPWEGNRAALKVMAEVFERLFHQCNCGVVLLKIYPVNLFRTNQPGQWRIGGGLNLQTEIGVFRCRRQSDPHR